MKKSLITTQTVFCILYSVSCMCVTGRRRRRTCNNFKSNFAPVCIYTYTHTQTHAEVKPDLKGLAQSTSEFVNPPTPADTLGDWRWEVYYMSVGLMMSGVVYICVHIYTYVYTYIRIYLCTHIYIHTYIHVCVCVYTHTHTHTHTHRSIT